MPGGTEKRLLLPEFFDRTLLSEKVKAPQPPFVHGPGACRSLAHAILAGLMLT